MNKEDKYFYLEKVFPNESKIISENFNSIDEIKNSSIFVVDTNILLFPYKISKRSLNEFERIFTKLIDENRFRLPSRVVREFGKNRGKNLSEVFKYLKQKEGNLNKTQFDFQIPPILENDDNQHEIKDLKKEHDAIIKKIKEKLQVLQDKIYSYNWNDPVSEMYKRIFNDDIYVDVVKAKEDIINDLDFRILHSIAPGFKDSNKSDKGIGDLIIWQTIKEIGKSENNDIIFVTDDSKNDWFYIEEKQTVYPRYELLYEFKQETGKTIHIIDITTFLELFETSQEVIQEIAEQKNYEIENEDIWEKISHFDIKEGMIINYASPHQDYLIESNIGNVIEVKPSEQFGTSIFIEYKNGSRSFIAGNSFSWRRKIVKK